MSGTGAATIHVIQGEFRISERAGDTLSTILGSCVATCLYDPARGIGGMNHFLLPHGDKTDPGNIKYGLNAMELLINSLLKKGASRHRLEAKLFGGARMMSGLPNVGKANAEFARAFLDTEGIRCVSTSLGGEQARKVRFWPQSGRAQVMLLDKILSDPAPPPAPQPVRRSQPVADITLF